MLLKLIDACALKGVHFTELPVKSVAESAKLLQTYFDKKKEANLFTDR